MSETETETQVQTVSSTKTKQPEGNGTTPLSQLLEDDCDIAEPVVIEVQGLRVGLKQPTLAAAGRIGVQEFQVIDQKQQKVRLDTSESNLRTLIEVAHDPVTWVRLWKEKDMNRLRMCAKGGRVSRLMDLAVEFYGNEGRLLEAVGKDFVVIHGDSTSSKSQKSSE